MLIALVYLSLGMLFSYLAINSGDDLWSIRTIFPAIIASIDFGVAIRLLRIKYYVKKPNKPSKRT